MALILNQRRRINYMHRLVSNDHYFHGGPPNYNVIKHFDLLTVTTIHSPNLTFVPSLSEISFLALSPPAWFSHGYTLKYIYIAFYFHQILKKIYCILPSPNSLIHALYFTIRELFNTLICCILPSPNS